MAVIVVYKLSIHIYRVVLDNHNIILIPHVNIRSFKYAPF
jgi:hypothetical protein